MAGTRCVYDFLFREEDNVVLNCIMHSLTVRTEAGAERLQCAISLQLLAAIECCYNNQNIHDKCDNSYKQLHTEHYNYTALFSLHSLLKGKCRL